MSQSDGWRRTTSRLRALISEPNSDGAAYHQCCSLVKELNAIIYPVDGLPSPEVHKFLCDVTRRSPVHSPQSVAQLAQLCHSILSAQKCNPPQNVEDQLFEFFTGWLPAAEPATEPLYLLALLKPSHEISNAVSFSVATLAVDSCVQLEVRRAALHYLTVLCDSECEAGKEELAQPLETLCGQVLEEAQHTSGSTARAKLVLSQLRAIFRLVKLASEALLQPLLPTLLAGLKFYMITGLPGQAGLVAPLPPVHAVPTVEESKKDHRPATRAGPHSSSHHSARPQRPHSIKPPSAPTTSDSEVSDGELMDSAISKALASKLRHQSLVCLASVFNIIGPRSTFSYWFSFLPDGPRMPHTPPSLLSCVLRDSSHKCRSAALAVLYALLEGSRPYLAAANDHILTAMLPFTPFSSQLGAILRELHHGLHLCLGTETQPVVLTRAVRCLAILITNTPYHQLSSGYTSRILSALKPLSQHRDIDVRVACLTCCGAVLSTSPALPEVASWLAQGPWLLTWCSNLLQPRSVSHATSLPTEALQVLAAATKFYFSSLIGHWETVVELCIVHLASPQQHHSLKLLEELCKASAELPEAGLLWPRLLEGPLTAILQKPTSPAVCSQACAVLATLSSCTMQQLQPPLHMLALTLALGLSRDDSVSPAISSSAIRVLGVYCTFSCLKEDEAFLQDCEAAILHAVASPSQIMRVQASWALANLTGVDREMSSFSPLLRAARQLLKDKDVVKCNAVRSLGNLLKGIPQFDEEQVCNICSELAQCTSSGTMKLRWNACYACHVIFCSKSFPDMYHKATDILLKALCETACACPNFKVCTNALLALASLASYTSSQLRLVWSAMLTSLERSLQYDEFPEFKQAANLRTRLCHCLCHVLSVQTDLTLVPSHPLSEPATACLRTCLAAVHEEDRSLLKAAEKKLSSSPAVVQTNLTLTVISSILHEQA